MKSLKSFSKNRVVGWVLIIIGAYIATMTLLMVYHDLKRPRHKPDVLMVLGAGLRGDIPSRALKNRLDLCLDLKEQHPYATILVTGGQGPDEWLPEGEAMAKYLVEHGIDEKEILVESKSTSTYENFLYSRDILKDAELFHGGNIWIISNKFHLFRSQFLADRLDYQAETIGAKTPVSVLLKTYVRELFAIGKSYLIDGTN